MFALSELFSGEDFFSGLFFSAKGSVSAGGVTSILINFFDRFRDFLSASDVSGVTELSSEKTLPGQGEEELVDETL